MYLTNKKPFNFIICVGLLWVIWTFNSAFYPHQKINYSTYRQSPEMADSIKTKAFKILEEKCNTCHLKKKPFYVFSLANMETFKWQIKEQVFIKQKMPKGRKNELTEQEKAALKMWVDLP